MAFPRPTFGISPHTDNSHAMGHPLWDPARAQMIQYVYVRNHDEGHAGKPTNANLLDMQLVLVTGPMMPTHVI